MTVLSECFRDKDQHHRQASRDTHHIIQTVQVLMISTGNQRGCRDQTGRTDTPVSPVKRNCKFNP